MAMTVKKDNNEVRIQWRVADIKIQQVKLRTFHKIKISMKYQNSIEIKFRESVLHLENERVIIDTDDHNTLFIRK